MCKINGSYSPQTGISTVIISDKHGNYIGTAKLHPKDKEYENEIIGCNIAVVRAEKKKLYKHRDKMRIKASALKSFKKEFLDYWKGDLKDIEIFIKRLDISINYYEKELKDIIFDIQTLRNQEITNKKLRKKIRTKINNK